MVFASTWPGKRLPQTHAFIRENPSDPWFPLRSLIRGRPLLVLRLGEGRVEQPSGGLEAHALLDKLRRLGRAVFPVHAAVFPLDGQRPFVADGVERPGDLLEVDLPAARRAE